MTALRATQKRRDVSGPTALIRVAPQSGIYRHGHWYKGGETLIVSAWDAAKMVKRGVAEWAT